jgi:DNA ligase-1
MQFKTFAEYLQKLEETTKRLEITQILKDMITELDTEESDTALYLASGYLKAPFENEKFNIAEKMMVRIVTQAYATPKNGITEDKITSLYNTAGDLGNVAYELAKTAGKTPENKDTSQPLTKVHEKLLEIATVEGTGSQDAKTTKAANLLKSLDPLSAKYAVRIILGTTRLGFTEITIIEALSNFLAGDKSLKKQIESHYNIHPDIGLITKLIKKNGLQGIASIGIEPGVPVLSQKAQRAGDAKDIMERIGTTAWAEFKFDGTRVQLHMDKNKKVSSKKDNQQDLFSSVVGNAADNNKENFLVKTYTRNLEETTHQYPDLITAAKEQALASSIILDGEAIGYDPKTGEFLPFQETMQRKRKHGVGDTAKNIPLKYFVFDILYLDGESLIGKPLMERKKILKKAIKTGNTIVVDEHKEIPNINALQEYFDLSTEKNLEGLIVKNPNDPYQAGARAYSWIKLKRADEKLLDDAVECVVLGYYAGRGARASFGIGGFLVGVYDAKEDVYKTITKVGTGLKDEDWGKLKTMADKVRTDKKPANVIMHKTFEPDVYLKPEIVVELGADEISVSPTHSAGYALRFPRLLKFREDKPAKETTSVQEIEDMFKLQRNI